MGLDELDAMRLEAHRKHQEEQRLKDAERETQREKLSAREQAQEAAVVLQCVYRAHVARAALRYVCACACVSVCACACACACVCVCVCVCVLADMPVRQVEILARERKCNTARIKVPQCACGHSSVASRALSAQRDQSAGRASACESVGPPGCCRSSSC